MVHLAFHFVVGRGTKEHRWIPQEYGLRLYGIKNHENLNMAIPVRDIIWGGWVRQRCRVPCITGVSS